MKNIIFPSLIIAGGIAAAGFFIGNTLYKSRVALNTVTVKGLAERRVDADQARWKISYTVQDKNKDRIPELYSRAEEHKTKIVSYLKNGGILSDEISLGVIDYTHQEYRNDDKELVDELHTLTGIIEIETKRVESIKIVRSNLNELMIDGINLDNHSPQYKFTRLNAIKPEMLKEATQNARIAAAEFATNSGSEVGRIRSARQGGFTIIDAGETYGDTKKLKKDVRVVTTSEFYVEN